MSGRKIAPRPAPPSVDTTVPQFWDPAAASAAGGALALIDANIEPQLLLIPCQPQTTVATGGVRKKVTSACQGCQKRRVKCDGLLPCSTCIRTNQECSYLPELDGRSIKRKFHQVQQDQDLLHDLLVTLRDSNDENISQIVSLIRADATLEDIKACITQQLIEARLDGRDRSPEFHQLRESLNALGNDADGRPGSSRMGLLSIRRLTDSPPYKVPAEPWTKVTNDNDLVSHLISVWSTWDKGWYDWLDLDLFIRDMKSGSLDSTFCSPFLVNCLLAWCCPYSDFREARSINGDPSPLMIAFIEEAKRLADDQSNASVSLTTIQGLFILHGALAVIGQDSLGYRYMLQGIGMLRDLANSPVASKARLGQQMHKDFLQAMSRTTWGLYIVSTQTLNALLKPQSLKAPRLPRPGQTGSKSQRTWTPYPISDVPLLSHRDDFFETACDISIIEAELTRVLFDHNERLSRKDLEKKITALHKDLQKQAAKLPPDIKYDVGSSPACFTHQTRVQLIVLRMFLALRDSTEAANPKIIQLAKKKCIEAACEIASSCKTYSDSWGATHMGIMMSHPCLISVSVLLEEQDNARYEGEITDLCIALRAMSRRWPLGMAMLRMVQMEARQKVWTLPSQTEKLFEEFEGKSWKQRTLKQYLTLYPDSTTSKTANLTDEEVDMGTFLASMELLLVEDSNGAHQT